MTDSTAAYKLPRLKEKSVTDYTDLPQLSETLRGMIAFIDAVNNRLFETCIYTTCD